MWTINNLLESNYVLERKGKIAGFASEQGEFGIKLIPVTLEDILNRFPGGYVCNRDGHRSIPNTILYELGPKIELVTVGELAKATGRLSLDDKIQILSEWFNTHQIPLPGKYTKSYLGHPTIFDSFIRWIIEYLSFHGVIDDRVSRESERMINLARELRDKPPVRRI